LPLFRKFTTQLFFADGSIANSLQSQLPFPRTLSLENATDVCDRARVHLRIAQSRWILSGA
ncbi:MAG: hypothetical protein ACI9G1_002875, partial [Pirellulaceae bacterium]